MSIETEETNETIKTSEPAKIAEIAEINKAKRIQMVRAMELLARAVNDETAFYPWLLCGVADEDINEDGSTPDEELEFYAEDDVFAELMGTFLRVMSRAHKSGGLYFDDVLSRD